MDPENPQPPGDELDDPALDAAAGAILDGEPIDWPLLTPAEGAEPKAELGQLRVLENLATLHRQASDTPDTWGSLRLLERVGGGMFGEVYRAWDARLDREVALKLLRARDESPGPADDVIDEGRLLARVKHPNVMTVYGAERIEGRVGVWTEFIHGRTLADLVRAEGRFNVEDATRIGVELGRALGAVHGAGLIHRDIKAANVMREDTGRLVLMDFGAGREQLVAAVTSTGELTGTPLYLAPELWTGAAATPQSDIYSLGVLLYFLVTGDYPVRGQSASEVQEAHRSGRRVALQTARPDLATPFVQVVEQALARDPSKRFGNAHELTEALQRLLPVAPSETRARRWRAAAIVVGVVLVALGTALWWMGVLKPTLRDGLACSNCLESGSLSADGRLIVDEDRPTGDLTIRDLTTTVPPRHLGLKTGRLTPANPSYAERPVISADGQRIAYLWHQGRDAPTELRVVNGQGAPQPQVILAGTDVHIEPDDWSPDGVRLLVYGQAGDRSGLAWVSIPQHTLAMVKLIDPRAVIIDTRPRVSPDGRFIAYTARATDAIALAARSDPDNTLHVISADGSRDQVVDLAVSVKRPVVWTAGSRRIVFTSNQSGTFDLWSLDVTDGRVGTTPSLIRANIGDNFGFVVTGDSVYYYRLLFQPTHTVRVENLNGPEPFTRSDGVPKAFPGMNARFSIDGQSIAYTNGGDLMLYSMLSGESRRLVAGLAQDSPLWLGARFLLSPPRNNTTSRRSLTRIDAETGMATPFAQLVPMSIGPSWGTTSLDSRTLFTGARDFSPGLPSEKGFDRIVAIDLATGQSKVVWRVPPSTPNQLMALALSPDGHSLAVVRQTLHSSEAWLERIDVDGRNHQLLLGPYQSTFPFEKLSWKGDSILYGVMTSKETDHYRWSIMRIPASGGTSTPTGLQFDGDGSKATFDFSPDGRHFVFYPGPEPPAVRDELWRLDLKKSGRDR